MTIVMGLDQHRAQITVEWIDTATGEWMRRTPAVLDLEWKAAGYPALVVTGDKSAQTASKD